MESISRSEKEARGALFHGLADTSAARRGGLTDSAHRVRGRSSLEILETCPIRKFKRAFIFSRHDFVLSIVLLDSREANFEMRLDISLERQYFRASVLDSDEIFSNLSCSRDVNNYHRSVERWRH